MKIKHIFYQLLSGQTKLNKIFVILLLVFVHSNNTGLDYTNNEQTAPSLCKWHTLTLTSCCLTCICSEWVACSACSFATCSLSCCTLHKHWQVTVGCTSTPILQWLDFRLVKTYLSFQVTSCNASYKIISHNTTSNVLQANKANIMLT